MKEKITYQETYKQTCVKEQLLPKTFPWLANDVEILRIDVKKAGVMEIDGVRHEFQDVRIVCKPTP